MESKMFSILSFLEQTQHAVTAKEIAEKLGISVRTVMRYMNVLCSSKEKSFAIQASKTKGYYLEIKDENKFNSYMNTQRQELTINEQNLELVLYIGLRKKVSIQELSNVYSYSTSTILRLIQQINEMLEDREIQIEKSKENFKLVGNEIKIRNYITMSFVNHPEYIHKICSQWDMYTIHLENILKENDIEYGSSSNLIYLIVTLIRCSNKNDLILTDIVRLLYRNHRTTTQKIENLRQRIVNVFDINLSDDECIFIQILLLKPDTEILDYNELFSYLKPIIEEALKNIDAKYNTYFVTNTQLLESLNYHVANCFEDYILMAESDNELLEQIKINFTNEYCYAIEFKKWIYQVLDIEIGDKDIGYIALHFANGSEIQDMKDSLNAQIIYKSNKTVATLLKSRINDKCSNIRVEQLVKADVIPNDLHRYDINFIFEDYVDDKEGVCKISPFLNYLDLEIINDEILKIQGSNALLSMLEKENFYPNLDVENKKILLETLLKQLKDKKYLSEKECKQLLEREKLTSTEIVLNVAFPHVIVEGKSFITIATLKHPVFWKNNFVKIIILMGLSKNDNKTRSAIQYLFNRLSNTEIVNRIEKNEKFEKLIKIIKGEC
ncbi:BglG family transcription antiterminator [Anaerorhabdus sp.]|uniref:BglG family transcription antiterminator n=1 Tax=Anaerorhabdus sp. TaxID=1872524 RepID=UPI002FC8986E